MAEGARGGWEEGAAALGVAFVVCRGECSPTESPALLQFLVAGQDQKRFCFCCLGKLSQGQENYLDKHSCPMLDTFWVCFTFLCSELAGGVSTPPMPWVCVLLCPALPKLQCAEQALIQRQ